MAENSGIEWTTHTFNPWRGCAKVSEGCANCYADTFSKRNPGTLGVWGPNGTRVVASEAMWREPVKWNINAEGAAERPRVFCASLADVFEDYSGNFPDNPKGVHGGVRCMLDSAGDRLCTKGGRWEKQWPDEAGWRPLCMSDVRYRLFEVINATPNLDWLLLTKRPENARTMLPDRWLDIQRPHNVWLGTSVENQAAVDERIPHLLKVPAAVRFLSVEPLLGPIRLAFGGIDWVIVGGESGHGARPCDIEWIRDVVRQCKAAGVPVFVKQLGSVPTNGEFRALPVRGRIDSPVGAPVGRFVDRKGGDWSEWPDDLRIREFPNPQGSESWTIT